MSRAIVLDQRDNVAVLLAPASSNAACSLQGAQSGEMRIAMDIPFGHKIALRAIKIGDDVVKYGEVVGRATATINAGEHVHVHNVESLRGRGDKVGKGR